MIEFLLSTIFIAAFVAFHVEASSSLASLQGQPPHPPADEKAQTPRAAQRASLKPSRAYLVERVGDFALVRLYADGFEELSTKEKILAYYFYKAALAGRDIAYQQNHRRALEVRAILEEIVANPKGIDPATYEKILKYTKLFWINNGMYFDRNKTKFVLECRFEELVAAALTARKTANEKLLKEKPSAKVEPEEKLQARLGELRATLFDPNFEPILTNKNPGPGQDLLTGSAVNFYENIALRDLENFSEKYPLNSKLIKVGDEIRELVYRAGNRETPPGLYASELSRIIYYLKKAMPYAEPPQQEALKRLIEFFETGDPEKFKQYNIEWVKDNPAVDTINGFIEVYKDPRGVKAEYEALVSFVDQNTSQLMHNLASHAKYFEQRSPWASRFKHDRPPAPIANAITVLAGVGGAGPAAMPAGIHLPNDDEITEQYGSKSVLLFNVMAAARAAVSELALREFALPEERAAAEKFGERARHLLVALHEITGHGSGRVSDKLGKNPLEHLREYGSALEEARADLVALWHIWDEKLIEWGAVSDRRVAEEAYRSFARDALVQLRRVKTGPQLEDDHMRAVHLIVSYLREKTKAIELTQRNGKSYFVVRDFSRMREGVGELLAELMRLKGEGDYEAAKKLFHQYGIFFDEKLRDEVVTRARAIGLPDYTAVMNPRLIPVFDTEKGSKEVKDVKISYSEDFVSEQLRYSRER